MGASPSLKSAELENQLREIQNQMEKVRLEAKRAAAENGLLRAQETLRQAEENIMIRASVENKLRKAQEALRQAEENVRIQEEIRVAAEDDLQRAQEALRQVDENIREGEVKSGQENQKRTKMEERRNMNDLARNIEMDANMRVEKEACLRKEAERYLKNGIPPVRYPTGDDIRIIREKLQYQQGSLHIAITGVSGSGKSSLINAFRGYSSKHPHAAKTGVCETTDAIGRYCDPTRPWMFWYDVPGAGTLKVPDWQYFNYQGLYIFDIIIIAVDIRFTKIDAALIFNCKRFGIPVFVVRSKADQHISNIMEEDREDDSGDEGNDTQTRFIMTRDKFVTDTRQGFATTIKEAGLPPQRAYIVSKDAIRSVIKGSKVPVDLIDEMDLIRDIFHAADDRYCRNQS